MKVLKRNGVFEEVSFDKISYRIKKLANDQSLGSLDNVDPTRVAMEVIANLYDNVSTSELDEVAARIAISMATDHPEYADLASRIIISNMHKKTTECFSSVIEVLYNNENARGEKVPLVSKELFEIVQEHKSFLDFAINYRSDYLLDYFGYKTLERSYLLKIHSNGTEKLIERPQTMWMRVSLGLHKGHMQAVLGTYHLFRKGYLTH